MAVAVVADLEAAAVAVEEVDLEVSNFSVFFLFVYYMLLFD